MADGDASVVVVWFQDWTRVPPFVRGPFSVRGRKGLSQWGVAGGATLAALAIGGVGLLTVLLVDNCVADRPVGS